MRNTVLDIFLHTTMVYGVPFCLRGDYGIENIAVATWMEEHHGMPRGSYIWGRFVYITCTVSSHLTSLLFWFRSIHNVWIKHLWVDVTAQVGAFWSNMFTNLKVWYGLDLDNIHHIWLLHHPFLHWISQQLVFFCRVLEPTLHPNLGWSKLFTCRHVWLHHACSQHPWQSVAQGVQCTSTTLDSMVTLNTNRKTSSTLVWSPHNFFNPHSTL